jgi:excisionase family DNA binding protein
VLLSDLPDVLTVEEAAAVLRIGRNAAYELTHRWRCTAGREGLPVIQLGRQLRVPRAALERLLAAAANPKEHADDAVEDRPAVGGL